MAESSSESVIRFWFEEIEPAAHWRKDPKFDALIRTRFGTTLDAALACELHDWRDTAAGRLAEVIVLDQFSRNIHRDTPRAFAADSLALALAQEAVRCGADKELPAERRVFLYMPWMHSESRRLHATAEQLFEDLGIESNLHFERRHREVIERFGRYPHRNAILGRASTAEELEFLAQPGSSF